MSINTLFLCIFMLELDNVNASSLMFNCINENFVAEGFTKDHVTTIFIRKRFILFIMFVSQANLSLFPKQTLHIFIYIKKNTINANSTLNALYVY